MKYKNEKIDFVVLWVDSNDKEWQESHAKYIKEVIGSSEIDDRPGRYRDWDLFKYWFRGVEQFAPWVNKVHLVTCGHLPKWLNVNHPKLHVVKHSDFMPKKALPTFNSKAIEFCIHRIPGLADKFVLFNDDMFILKKVKPNDYFKNNMPVNTMSLFAIMPCTNGKNYYKVLANNITIINKHFEFSKSKRQFLPKYLSLKQREWVLFTYPLLAYNQFMGFRAFHIPISYSKKTFEEVWKKEPALLNAVVHNRFRNNNTDVNHWLINYWQFASGDFVQHDSHFGISLPINDKKVPKIISKQTYHELCLNDVDDVDDFTDLKQRIAASFKSILPEKSGFEK